MPTLEAIAQPRLNLEFLETHPELTSDRVRKNLPERVLQFGEGGFLRGFVDWMIHGMNQQGLFNGRVVVIQPIAEGQIDALNRQTGAFTHLMRGLEGGKIVERREVITSISRGINPYTNFDEYLRCAQNPDLRFIVSNTTEAGIAYNGFDRVTDAPPASFPAKLTRLLFERYTFFHGDLSRGFIILPCELIDRNGDRLQEAILKTAANWNLSSEFMLWVVKANTFTNTLVDRIVTGYPKSEADALQEEYGYKDDLLDATEVFHLWVIESTEPILAELPLVQAGFNVIMADTLKPYRDRKVSILNGAHTATALAAYLAGFDSVGDCVEDTTIAAFMRGAIYEEIIPNLDLPRAELESFAEKTFERFHNPYIQHSLQSIALNSVSKYRTRILPSLERYIASTGQLPRRLTLALASLIVYYRGTSIVDGTLIAHRDYQPYKVKDDLAVLQQMAASWAACDGSIVAVRRLANDVLMQTEWWDKDLREVAGLSNAVANDIHVILIQGMRAAIEQTSL
jgi:tagaturonate reductase